MLFKLRAIGAPTFALAAAISCGGDRITAPPPPPPPPPLTCPTAQAPFCSDPVAAREAVSDALRRSAPALENATARGALVTSLTQLDAALNAGAGNITEARAAVGRAREALGAANAQLATFPGDAPDLGAIELTLDYVAPLLGIS